MAFRLLSTVLLVPWEISQKKCISFLLVALVKLSSPRCYVAFGAPRLEKSGKTHFQETWNDITEAYRNTSFLHSTHKPWRGFAPETLPRYNQQLGFAFCAHKGILAWLSRMMTSKPCSMLCNCLHRHVSIRIRFVSNRRDQVQHVYTPCSILTTIISWLFSLSHADSACINYTGEHLSFRSQSYVGSVCM